MIMRVTPFILLTTAALSLAACSQAKEQLGLTRSSPDEFAVVKRAPLAMPPEYTLRAPRPGAPRPQEQHPSAQAQGAVFGNAGQPVEGLTKGEAAFLDQAGTGVAQPGIRDIVDQETAAIAPKQQTVAKRLLNIGSDKNQEPEASVVDPIAEAERLKQNKAEGKPVTAGETPAKTQ